MKIIPKMSVRILPKFFASRFRLAAMTSSHPRFAGLVRRIAFQDDDMIVLPKNATSRKTIDLDINIEDAGERNVVPSDLIRSILRRADKIFIMNFCLCRKSNKCQDYPVERGCIFLGKGTERIPSDFGRFVDAEEAIRYVDECAELGLVHIIGRNKLDSLWLSTGKKTDLMTICNCCPCCCLWNMVRDIHGSIASTYKRMSGVEITVDSEKCVGCGICDEICFVKAIRIIDGKCILDDEKCRACGRCSEQCPTKAIKITYDPDVIESETERIYNLVNLKE